MLFEELNKTDDKRRKLIHFAAAGGCLPIIHQLEELGFGISQESDINGYEPIHYSAESGTIEVFHFLFSKGADVFSTLSFLAPFQIACQNGFYDIVDFIYNNDKMVK